MAAASLPLFRSHLMQQFASAARSQSRPPMVLMGTLKSSSRSSHLTTTPSTATPLCIATCSPNNSDPLDHIEHSRISNTTTTRSSVNCQRWKTCPPRLTQPVASSGVTAHSKRWLTTRPLLQDDDHDDHQHDDDNDDDKEQNSQQKSLQQSPSKLALAFQSLINTRRTSSRFVPWDATMPSISTSSSSQHQQQQQQVWKLALYRAVACAQHAPNHKRTEPFTFTQMIAPSASTHRLAEIVYHVTLRKQRSNTAATTSLGNRKEQDDDAWAEQVAQQKRAKFLQVPAFLVTVVSNNQAAAEDSTTTTTMVDPYQPLAFVPPSDERQLEDYAAACAAVQNVLLSLHAEGIASKWATGQVIHTPAFRDLVQAQPTDRIVALILIGMEETTLPTPPKQQQPLESSATTTSSSSTTMSHVPKRRHAHRYRRSISGDLLRELD